MQIVALLPVDKKDKEQRLMFKWLRQSFDLVLWHRCCSEDQGLYPVSDALQACRRSLPSPDVSSVQYHELSIREGMCDRKKRTRQQVWQYRILSTGNCMFLKTKSILLSWLWCCISCWPAVGDSSGKSKHLAVPLSSSLCWITSEAVTPAWW